MKKKKSICHALEFAKQNHIDKPWIQDLKRCDQEFKRSYGRLKEKGIIQEEWETENLSRMTFTVNRWLTSKQCYSITEALAEDLFAMEDLSFPLDAMHLPFPCFYLDMEPFSEDFDDVPGAKLLGYYVIIDEVPYGEDAVASCCSIVILAMMEDGTYVYGGAVFDYDPDHMEQDLNETVARLSGHIPEQRKHFARALLFAAYLSSEQPEVTENGTQKQIYRPSAKPKYSSIRKWDVGIRYMQEKQAYEKKQESGETGGKVAENNSISETSITAAEEKSGPRRNPPRPHMRRAHWQTYRTGKGRTGKKVLWIPPVTVGMPKNRKQEDIPVVIRERKEKKE